jgi:hypothetical protein
VKLSRDFHSERCHCIAKSQKGTGTISCALTRHSPMLYYLL